MKLFYFYSVFNNPFYYRGLPGYTFFMLFFKKRPTEISSFHFPFSHYIIIILLLFDHYLLSFQYSHFHYLLRRSTRLFHRHCHWVIKVVIHSVMHSVMQYQHPILHDILLPIFDKLPMLFLIVLVFFFFHLPQLFFFLCRPILPLSPWFPPPLLPTNLFRLDFVLRNSHVVLHDQKKNASLLFRSAKDDVKVLAFLKYVNYLMHHPLPAIECCQDLLVLHPQIPSM